MKTDKVYDVLKHIALLLPLVITFVTTICQIYDCAYTVQIVSTMAAVNTLIAGIVEIMNANYYKKVNDVLTTFDEVDEDDGE